MAQTTSLVFNGGSIPSPAPAPTGSGKAKLLKIGEIEITEQGVQVTKKVICDPDSVTAVAPFMEVLTSAKLAELVEANSIIVLDGGDMQYLMANANITVEEGISVCTAVNFLGLSQDKRAKVAYNCTRITDELTLQQVVEVGGPVETDFNLVIADSEDTAPNTLIDKMEVVSNEREPDEPTILQLETTVDGQGNHKVAINEDNLRTFVKEVDDTFEDVWDEIGELPSDEHGYFNSSLYTTPGDGTTTNLVMGDFRISENRDVHGDSIEFVPTHQEGGVDFGEVWLEPGTYILATQFTLQWVGNPRGTFLPLVANVADQPFDFSYEHEDVIRTTRIITRTTRGKLVVNIAIDADTPPMGVWVKNLEVAQIASYNHPAVTHDTTLAGSGQIGDPLGVTPAAFGKVKDIPTSVSQFRNGDVIPVDGPNGPAKMGKDDLLKETAQNALAGNVAQEFSIDASYVIGEKVAYKGKRYFFKSNHSAGSWNPGHVYEDKYLASTTLIKEIFSSTSTIYFSNFKAGDSVHFSFSSADWVNTSGSAAVVIACFKSDGSYAYYKSYSDKTSLLSKGFDLLIPSNSLYSSLTLRVDAGYSVVTEAKNNGAVSLYGYVGDVQGDDLFEMGNISMSGTGNTYSASTTRVRTKTAFKAYAGDKIVADTSIVFYVNTKPAGSDTWNPVGWNSGEFIVSSDCDICLLFRLSTEATTSVAEICSKFVIYSSRSSFAAANRLLQLSDRVEHPQNPFKKRLESFTIVGDGTTLKYTNYFNVEPGKIYVIDFPAYDATGVTNMYLLKCIQYQGDVEYKKLLKTVDAVPALTWYLFVPFNMSSVRIGLRAAVGETVTLSVYEFAVDKVLPAETIKDVAHRGNNSEAVENTIPAYRLAAGYGYKYVETDVRMTSDKYLVCLHDDTVNALSDGTGYITQMTLAQAKTLDFGVTKSAFFAGTKIATFSEVLAECKQLGLHLYIDIKQGYSSEYVGKIVDEVISMGMLDNVSFIRGDFDTLSAIKTLVPSARVGFLGVANSDDITSLLSLSNREDKSDIFIDAPISILTTADIELAKAAGIPLEVWVKDNADMTGLEYVSGITSNSTVPATILKKIETISKLVPTLE